MQLALETTLTGVLLASGKVTEDILRTVIHEEGLPPFKACQRLVDMGFVAEEELLKIFSAHFKYPYVSLKNFQPREELFIEGLSENFMRETKCVPIEVHDGRMKIATNNPFDPPALDAFKMVSGRAIEVNLAKDAEISDAIEKIFSTGASAMDRLIESTGGAEGGEFSLEDDGDVDHLKDLASEAPVIRLVNMLISRAIELKASDIHFEPFEKSFHVRYRIDGVLHDVESPPKNLQAAVISRIKIMSKLNIAERRLPQDGRIKLRVMGKEIDFRVSTLPTLYGESVVMRILDSESIVFDLDLLGFPTHELENFGDLIRRPYGIILVTGPTGSGKTTTLYSALSKINNNENKIITVEDPVEYQLDGINQIHVKPAIGLTFANCLRSILRQDPDVIMIGEIRDAETAEIAIHSALTGHLVFSTLHTNDAAGAVTRLIEMGMENYLVSSSLLGIMAQRLVRVICPHCKEEYPATEEMLREMGMDPAGAGSVMLARGRGCEQCANTGYRGRSGIYELLLLHDDVRKLILSEADSKSIKDRARELGMQTLREAGWDKVLEQVTTVSEVIRVTQVE
jgi:general secretion pathway protein E